MKEEKSVVWHKGQTIWVPHEAVGYTTATILENKGDSVLSVRLDEFEKIVDVNTSSCESVNADKDTILSTDDLTKLPDLHRPALLDALKQRFKANKIYTYTGHILIAINPFKDLDLYGKNVMKRYIDTKVYGNYDLPPHAYNMSNNAFLSMIENSGLNQSILVSGESGAGKTVTTKIVLDYLTTISQIRGKRADMASTSGSNSPICDKVLQSNPLLEAFGNAKTLRNDNSSRFGKLIQLQFEANKSNLLGCRIDTYLLEKSRVLNHAKGERNFHIFYELHAGLSEDEKEKYNMPHIEDSLITNAHDHRVVRGDITDKEQYQRTVEAMKTVGLAEDEMKHLHCIVIAVMHLGEVAFEEIKGSAEEATRISDNTKENAEMACNLLGIEPKSLEDALCSRLISLKDTKTLVKPHNMQQAVEARNALTMALYERMFLWLAWKINQSLKTDASSLVNKKVGNYYHDHNINCLDIFGFEVFVSNTFEQLFINYANEVLQQLFNDFVFKIEQKIYESEGIDWTKISFPDNYACIDMIEDKKNGLLKFIDDECLYPKGNDKSLHDKIDKNLTKTFETIFVDGNRQRGHNLFSIRHFAGDVEYNTASFCLKNKNELRQEQINCVRSSSYEFIKTLLPEDVNKASGAATSTYFDEVEADKHRRKKKVSGSGLNLLNGGTQKLQQSTVGNNFKIELNGAIDKIKASQLHFIRCIKPNDQNLEMEFDRKRTLEQLNYSGVLEAVRISRLGYSSRFLFKDFVGRFFALLGKHYVKIKSEQNAAYKNSSKDILDLSNFVRFEDYQIGNSKVFLRSDAFSRLESLKREKLYDSAVRLQKNVKTFIFKSKLHKRIQERQRREAELKRRREEEEARIKAIMEQAKQKVEPVQKVESPRSLEEPLSPPKPKLEPRRLPSLPPRKEPEVEVMNLTVFEEDYFNPDDNLPQNFEELDLVSDHETIVQEHTGFKADDLIEFGQNLASQILERVGKLKQNINMNTMTEQDLIMLGSGLAALVLLFTNAGSAKVLINVAAVISLAAMGVFLLVEMKSRNDRQKQTKYKLKKKPKKKKNDANYGNEETASEYSAPKNMRNPQVQNYKTARTVKSLKSEKTEKNPKTSKFIITHKKSKRDLTEKVMKKKKEPKNELSTTERIALQQSIRKTHSFTNKTKLNDVVTSSKRYTGISMKRSRAVSDASGGSLNSPAPKKTDGASSEAKGLSRKSSKFSGLKYSLPQ